MNRLTAAAGRVLSANGRARTAAEKPGLHVTRRVSRAIDFDEILEPVSSLPKLDLPKAPSRVPYRCQADWCRQFVIPDHKRPGVCNFCETPIGEKATAASR